MNLIGFEIPPALSAAVVDGRWRCPSDGVLVGSVFGEEPWADATFYSFAEMEGETTNLVALKHPAYLGVGDDDLDLARAILIGDLSHDRPFALDYRTNPPQVRLLRIDGRWVVIADSIDELISKLGLDPGEASGWTERDS